LIPDCIIVGGGIVGLLTARELAQAGQRVIILERGEKIGGEASWAGGGVLASLYPWQTPQPVQALIRWSRAYYPHLAQELANTTTVDPEWTQSGLLSLDTEYRREALNWASQTGEIIEYVEAERLKALEPRVGIAHRGALWLPELAQIRNPRLLRALSIALENSGVSIFKHTEVQVITSSRGDRIEGLRTTRGRFVAGSVVVAAGAWSGTLLEGFSYKPEIIPVRGQMIVYRTPPGFVQHLLLKQDCYIIPRRDGHLLVGSTVEYVGFDKSTTEEARRTLEAGARQIIPGLANHRVVEQWAGLRPGAPQAIPFIGPHPGIKNLYLNSGHFRNGLAAGPASARLLADFVLGRTPILPPEPFAWDRGL
jgi:glycine oxidase